jgi:hypothetical protein
MIMHVQPGFGHLKCSAARSHLWSGCNSLNHCAARSLRLYLSCQLRLDHIGLRQTRRWTLLDFRIPLELQPAERDRAVHR